MLGRRLGAGTERALDGRARPLYNGAQQTRSAEGLRAKRARGGESNMPEMEVSNPAVECLRCAKLFGPVQIFHLREDPRRSYVRCQHCGAKNEVRAEDRYCIRLVGLIPEPTPDRPGGEYR